MNDPLHITKKVDDTEQTYHAVILRKNIIILILLVLALMGWAGWQIAGSEQKKAVTNAKVAQAGLSPVDEVVRLCKEGSPAVKAELNKKHLCQEAEQVQALKTELNKEHADVGPTMVRVGGVETVTADAPPASALFTIPTAFGERTIEVTSVATQPGSITTVPGPATTEIVTSPGPATTEVITEPGAATTEYITKPGPVTTEYITVPGAPVTNYVTVPGTNVTETVTIPGPTQTLTITVTGTPPIETSTVTEPPVTDTVTETIPGPTETITEVIPPGDGNGNPGGPNA